MERGGEGRLPATARLKRRTDLEGVYRQGTVRSERLFSLYTLRREGEGRLGILIPRGWGSAVERNRVKRLFREAFRRHRGELAGLDLVVRPSAACKGSRAEEIESALVRGLRAAIGTEVTCEQGNDLPDEGGARPHAAGAGPRQEDPV